MSFNLASWIYEHAVSNGWVNAGEVVVDPFGGVAGTAFHAMKHGLRWVGCELEPKFVDLGKRNLESWQRRFAALPNYGSAVLVQGDSRNLRSVLAKSGVLEASCVASSPPYSESIKGEMGSAWKDTDKRSKNSNSKYAAHYERYPEMRLGKSAMHEYGQSPGQLGAMKEGQAPALAVSSPPYVEGLGHGGKPTRGAGRDYDASLDAMQNGYGTHPGQLSAMPEGVAAAVGSPPFEAGVPHQDPNFTRRLDGSRIAGAGLTYGDTAGNLGNQSGDTFWSASRLIVQEVYAMLKPGGVAIWVCGDFVRKGKRVPFCDQWQALCESLGFRLLCRHKAWKKSHNGTQKLLDGTDHHLTKSKVSFFRRLHARKHPECAVENEEVICLRRPAGAPQAV